jgi:hypothetical protein
VFGCRISNPLDRFGIDPEKKYTLSSKLVMFTMEKHESQNLRNMSNKKVVLARKNN